MNSYFRKIMPYLSSFLLLLLVYFSLPVDAVKRLPFGDVTIFEYFGYAMSRGDTLYINMFDHKGPVIFLINYIGYSIAGKLGIKLVYVLSIFLFIYFTYKITTIFDKNNSYYIFVQVIVIIIFLNVFELGFGLEGYMLPFITYSFYIYLDYFINGYYSKLRLMALGFSFAVVMFTKLNMVGLWFILSIGVIVSLLFKKEYKQIFVLSIYFIIGLLIFVIPILVYLYNKSALYAMYYQSIIINFKYSGLQGIGLKETINWLFLTLNQFSLIFIAIAGSILMYLKNKKKYLTMLLVMMFIFCLSMTVISKRNYLHYLIVIIPLFIPYIYIVVESLGEKLNKIVLSIIMFFAIILLYYPQISNINDNIKNREINNAKSYEIIAEYIKNNTERTDRIYSHQLQGVVYLLSDRLSSTKYFFIPSLQENIGLITNDFKENFEKNLPKIIVTDKKYLSGTRIDEYIVEKINEKYEIVKVEKDLIVYKLK